MSYAFNPAPQPTLPIKGSGRLFPIHRVYCVGRNYAEHTREMGGDTRDPPFFFQKNPDNVAADGRFPYPPATANVHHEIELVVALKSGGVNIKAADANAAGQFIELYAILAVVLGGTSLMGGKFSVAGTVVGVLIIQTLDSMILFLGVPPAQSPVFFAIVVVLVWGLVVAARVPAQRARQPV